MARDERGGGGFIFFVGTQIDVLQVRDHKKVFCERNVG